MFIMYMYMSHVDTCIHKTKTPKVVQCNSQRQRQMGYLRRDLDLDILHTRQMLNTEAAQLAGLDHTYKENTTQSKAYDQVNSTLISMYIQYSVQYSNVLIYLPV